MSHEKADPPDRALRQVALLPLKPEKLTEEYGFEFTNDRDDLDAFSVASVIVDGQPYVLTRHWNSPEPGTVLWADPEVHQEEAVDRFVREFDLPDAYWVLP